MNISTVLEIAIGIFVVYYALSVIVSTINSWVLSRLQQRAKDLKTGIEELITDPELRRKFWQSFLIRNLEPKQVKFFSLSVAGKNEAPKRLGPDLTPYVPVIPSKTFAQALVNELLQEDPSFESLKARLSELGAPTAGVENVEQALQASETWFDDKMTAVSALYKQHARRIAILLALVVTLISGADTVEIVSHLNASAATRAALVAQTDQILVQGQNEDAQAIIAQLETTDIPLLWSTGLPTAPGAIALKLVGLLVTWAAISQGSSFWYQVLNKIRSSSRG